MNLRLAGKQDLPRLQQLIDQLGYKVSSHQLQKNLTQYDSSVFVLELQSEVIGCLAFHVLPQFHSEEKHMRIVSLVVDEKMRGKGFGKMLVEEAEKIAHYLECSVIELTSAAHRLKSGAHDFYKGQGYFADGEKIYFRKKLLRKDPEK